MPLVDLPLEQLLTYQGRNPRPADFDAFWEAALAEMRAVDPEVRLEPVPSPAHYADCFDLTYTGVGGARVYAKLARPKKLGGNGASAAGPALVKFHGYTMDSGDWFELLPYVANGFTMVAMDARGQGGRSEDPGGVAGNTQLGHVVRGLADAPEKMLFRSIYLDAAQLAGLVFDMEGVDPARVGAFGFSQGGALTLACAGLEPRLARIAPVYPFLCDLKRVWEMDLAHSSAYSELGTWFRRFDPLHERAEEVFTQLGYIDNQFLAERIRSKTLMVIGLMDNVCPPSGQFAAYNRIPAEKETLIYPDFGHEGLPQIGDRLFRYFCDM